MQKMKGWVLGKMPGFNSLPTCPAFIFLSPHFSVSVFSFFWVLNDASHYDSSISCSPAFFEQEETDSDRERAATPFPLFPPVQ